MVRRGPIRLATDKSIRAATHLTDADAENGETETWFDFASDCESSDL